jgi:hypothetical protein
MAISYSFGKISSIMTTFLTLLTTTSGIVLAITDEGKVVRKNKDKRKNIKVCLIKSNLKKLVLVFMLSLFSLLEGC